MCYCGTPTVNGQPGEFLNHLRPPDLSTDDTLVFDEPGRCGGIDCHAYHYRLVKTPFGGADLLVRHGGGSVRVRISNPKALIAAMEALDSHGRFWVFSSIYFAHSDAQRAAHESEAATWRQAAAEGRIKTRKLRGKDAVRVTIIPAPL